MFASLTTSREPAGQRRIAMSKGTVIILEDDDDVSSLVRMMLDGMEYTVIITKRGEDAVQAVKDDSANKIVAMLADLTIRSGSGGKEAVSEIRNLNSQFPIFVMSGSSHHPAMQNPTEFGFNASIQKPFTVSGLQELFDKYMK